MCSVCQHCLFPADPHQFLLFTQEHELPIEDAPTVTDVRIISLDTPSVFIDTLTPVTIPGSSAKFIAYDITQHKVQQVTISYWRCELIVCIESDAMSSY